MSGIRKRSGSVILTVTRKGSQTDRVLPYDNTAAFVLQLSCGVRREGRPARARRCFTANKILNVSEIKI
jgi:hypothetical protein